MKAFILAAGCGSRMRPLAQDRPKCLLPIQDETILGRQLRILRSCGIADITVVAGFKHEKITELVAGENRIVYNPDYESTNSIVSLWLAGELMTDGFLVLNADVIFTQTSIRRLLADGNTYSLLVTKNTCDAEDMKVAVSRGTVVGVSKTVHAEEAYGAFAQVAKVNREGAEQFREALGYCASEDPQQWWPAVFALLAARGHRIGVVDARDPWMEVDTPEDYERARRLFGLRNPDPNADLS
jgi:choline kinase